MAVAFQASTSTTATGANASLSVNKPAGSTDTEPSTYSFSADSSSTDHGVLIQRYSGVSTTSPILTAASFAGYTGSTDNGSTSHVAPSLAWSTGSMLSCSWATRAAGSGWTIPANMTRAGSVPTAANLLTAAYRAYGGSSPTGTETATYSTSQRYLAGSIVLGADAGAGGELFVAWQTANSNGAVGSMAAPAGWTTAGTQQSGGGSGSLTCVHLKVYYKFAAGVSAGDPLEGNQFLPFFG